MVIAHKIIISKKVHATIELMNHLLIGEIAGVLAIIQVVPYIVSIFRGHTKPERTSYFIWFMVDTVKIASYVEIGARTTIYVPLVFTFTAFIIFLLSIKYGMGGVSKFDTGCFFLAVFGIIMWMITNDALFTLYFTTTLGLVGYLPTIRKAYFLPQTENTLSWTMTAFTGTLNLLALTTLSLKIALPPACGAVTETIVAYLVLFPRNRFKFEEFEKPHKIHAFLTHPLFEKWTTPQVWDLQTFVDKKLSMISIKLPKTLQTLKATFAR
jgi:hypothetical protein